MANVSPVVTLVPVVEVLTSTMSRCELHARLTQSGVSPAQTTPHPPQLFTESKLELQPASGLPHAAQPGSHVGWQDPPAQLTELA